MKTTVMIILTLLYATFLFAAYVYIRIYNDSGVLDYAIYLIVLIACVASSLNFSVFRGTQELVIFSLISLIMLDFGWIKSSDNACFIFDQLIKWIMVVAVSLGYIGWMRNLYERVWHKNAIVQKT